MSVFRTRSSSSHSAVKLGRWLGIGLLIAFSAHAAVDQAEVRINSPCSDAEAWQLKPRFAKRLPPELRAFVKGLNPQNESAVRAFADAFTLRQKTKKQDDVIATLADYAIARSLHHASVFGLAAEQFDRIVQAPTSPGKSPIQIAAISCLGQIHRRYSAFAFSSAALARVPDFFKKGQPTKREQNILWYAVTEQFLTQLKAYDRAGGPKEKAKLTKQIKETLGKLQGSKTHEALAQGLWAAHNSKAKESAAHLTTFVQAEGLTEALESKRDAARLLLARNLYELGDYKAAISQLELIDKRANELVPSLVYLASAQLMLENYKKAIGASLGLQSGSLRETFAPESLMVASMALNELCHFPESLALVNKFKRQYQNTFFWLRDRAKGGAKEKEPLYPLAVAFLKGEKPKDAPKDDLDDANPTALPSGVVPPRVGSEWLRSSIFVSKQDSINHLFRTMRKIPKLVGLGRTLIKTEARAIAETKAELTEKVNKARKALKPGEKLDGSLLEELAVLRVREAAQARLTYALPHLANALTGYQSRAQQWLGFLTTQIEGELRELNARMYNEILSVTENYELIEAEIWNGASQDIVWQNAHPEFREMVKSGKLANDRSTTSASDVYDWGSAGQGLDGAEEVWEDEIGAIQANLQNDCANKEKYMKLQRRQ